MTPQHALAYNNRGVAYHDKADYAGAISDYDRALEIEFNVKNAAGNKTLAQAKLVETKKKKG
ncbi:MAG: tetratricopeptide repeat protein [Rhodomicrobium sp.]